VRVRPEEEDRTIAINTAHETRPMRRIVASQATPCPLNYLMSDEAHSGLGGSPNSPSPGAGETVVIEVSALLPRVPSPFIVNDARRHLRDLDITTVWAVEPFITDTCAIPGAAKPARGTGSAVGDTEMSGAARVPPRRRRSRDRRSVDGR
jgi:hypothetical protein